MDVSKFNEKLNRVDSHTYVIEETVYPVNGVYEKELIHDNVNIATLNVYTGSKLTGDKIDSYSTSTPSLTPWKTIIRIFSSISPLYISYETIGDQIEAEDINNLQGAVNDTQKALNDEIDRATNAENVLTDNLNSEVLRAKGSENTLNSNLNAEVSRAKAAENTITNTINSNKPNWDDKYTRNEIDNKFNVYTTNLDWKESVATFNDIVQTYPSAQDGWTVNVKDTDITYRYDGSAWTPISANSIPLATKDVDGKMSKQDKIDHDDMVSKRHIHSNKGILDVITQALLDTWNSAYTHISDTIRHITSTERSLWNTVANKLDRSGGTMTGAIVVSDLGSKDIPPIIINGPNTGGGTPAAERYIDYKFDSAGTTRVGAYRGVSWDNYFKVQVTATGPNDFIDLIVAGISVFNYKGNKIYHAGNKPTIDEIGAAPSGYGLGADGTNIAGFDLNTIQTTGFYIGNACSNAPNNGWFYYIVISHPDKGWTCQYAISYGSGNAGNILYTRTKINGTWSSWSNYYSNNNKPSPSDIGAYTKTETDNKFATKDQISQAGYGDMLKSVYDTNNDGVVDNADKLDGKHANEFFGNMFEVGNTIDWNTLTTSGCYKIQMSSWGTPSNTHSPAESFPSLYPYGMLKVYTTGVASELRIIQEYYPHGGGDLIPRIRMHNANDWSSGWNPWTKITKGQLTWNDLEGI